MFLFIINRDASRPVNNEIPHSFGLIIHCVVTLTSKHRPLNSGDPLAASSHDFLRREFIAVSRCSNRPVRYVDHAKFYAAAEDGF